MPDLLRFLTCGSVDDGKSTLIGRLLYESHQLRTDQLAELERDSRHPDSPDFALLLDGLAAEREQGITIDVAHRFFATPHRTFIVADTPGHEQYTRNMVTAASTTDAAVLLIDARKGLLPQTRRHTELVSLLGIRTVALAVNKLDLVDYSRQAFDAIADEYRSFAATLSLDDPTCIPVSALEGSNVVTRSDRTPWYTGPSLLDWLESVPVDDRRQDAPFRMIVQWVNRPSPEFRGLSGRILGGTIRPGDPIRVFPGGHHTTVARIVTFDGDLPEAVAGQSVTVLLADDLDASRGAVLAAATDPPTVAGEFDAHLIWMSDQPLLPARSYLAKIGARTVGATAAHPLHLNEIANTTLRFDTPVAFDPYHTNRDLGSVLLIDRLTNATVGAALLNAAHRPSNLRWQHLTITKPMRANRNGHRGCVVWFTGLSAAGKSTIANLVEQHLYHDGRHTYTLDGDNVRHGLNKDLGFTDTDRVENVRRVAEVAALMVDAGLIVLVAFISPFAAERALARSIVAPGEFCEVHVDTPLAVAEQRDPKGLYAKARRGELPHFTGIDSPYEPPEHPELRIDTTTLTPEQAASAVINRLREMRVFETAQSTDAQHGTGAFPRKPHP